MPMHYLATGMCTDLVKMRQPEPTGITVHQSVCHLLYHHLEWHNRKKRIARKAHPNLYEVLELFQREQAATEVIIQQLEAGGVRKAKRRKVV